jgi:hypothetical protein
MTTTTTMTSARIAMLRVLMATRIDLLSADASPRIWRPGAVDGSNAASRQAVRLTGTGWRSYAPLAM